MDSLIARAKMPTAKELQTVLKNKPPTKTVIKDDIDKPFFDVAKALSLRLKNKLPYQKIADLLNVSKTTVYDNLKWVEVLIQNPQEVDAYKENRGLLLNSAELMVLKELTTGGSLEKASANNLGYLYDKLNNARRLEEDKSTANVSYHQAGLDEEEIEKELRDIDSQISD